MKTIHKGMLAALFVVAPAVAFSSPVHNISSTSAFEVDYMGVSYAPVSSNAVVSWNETTKQAFVNARATTAGGAVFEFQFVEPTASTTGDEIDGYWDIYKSGTLVCSHCLGSAYGLSGPVGYGFKIYVNGEYYGFAGRISSRYDY
jgi:hypothetical protein